MTDIAQWIWHTANLMNEVRARELNPKLERKPCYVCNGRGAHPSGYCAACAGRGYTLIEVNE